MKRLQFDSLEAVPKIILPALLLSRVRIPPPAPWPCGGPESLRSPCCGLAIYKNQTKLASSPVSAQHYLDVRLGQFQSQEGRFTRSKSSYRFTVLIELQFLFCPNRIITEYLSSPCNCPRCIRHLRLTRSRFSSTFSPHHAKVLTAKRFSLRKILDDFLSSPCKSPHHIKVLTA
ncbi:hypothetical protein PoB_002958500 [Plakobranchus ocellatus]|uniref:Uncharacterized protein n=1 Tax=Plakobranchus ocellatus TaxID=259542 RepID=A0AAV4A6S2_9GAST|nr:hypothetical protein PoB_002958500 [Plakobranchus ocellatus]